MTRQEIKNKMIRRINAEIEAEINSIDIGELVDDSTITDFLCDHDFGMEIAYAYIENHTEEILYGYLQEIYDEIDETDLEAPW